MRLRSLLASTFALVPLVTAMTVAMTARGQTKGKASGATTSASATTTASGSAAKTTAGASPTTATPAAVKAMTGSSAAGAAGTTGATGAAGATGATSTSAPTTSAKGSADATSDDATPSTATPDATPNGTPNGATNSTTPNGASASASPELAAASTTDTKATPSDRKRANWHPRYGAEIEPHFVIAGLDKYQAGLGAGINVTIPIWQNAPFRRIDDDISFGVGLDWVRYAAYQPLEPRGGTVLTQAFYVPVFVQWNIWLGSRTSIFLEPTLLFRFATYPNGCPVPSGASCEDTTRVLPTGSVGLRFRIVDHVAATIRVGWPMVTIGASWL